MTARNAIPRRTRAALALAVMFFAAMLALRLFGLPRALQPDAAVPALRAERERLAAVNDVAVSALRQERDLLRRPTQSGDSVPPGWSRTAGEAGRVHYRYTGESALMWPALIQAIAGFERRSGGRLESIDIRSRGSRTRRALGAIEITTAGESETTRRPAGATFPSLLAPASPRTTGRGPSLRLPSASAPSRRAADSGAASAPFRPGSPRPAGGAAGPPETFPTNPP